MDPEDEAVMLRRLLTGLREDYGEALQAEDITLGEARTAGNKISGREEQRP